MPSTTSSRSADARAVARRSPAGLAKVVTANTSEPYVMARWIKLLVAELMEVAAGRNLRLIVTVHPRAGKSEMVSKYFPAWFLGNFPDKRIILASYEQDFAAEWGGKARDLLEEWGEEIFGVTVDPRSSSTRRWNIKGRRGVMYAAGVGGPITGKGADIAIIDDYFKGEEDAHSKVTRAKIKNWFRTTLRSRLVPKTDQSAGGAIIILATRWHHDDLIGWLKKESNETWRVIELPAIYDGEGVDPMGREVGEAMAPELGWDEEAMEKIRLDAGTYGWNALYMGRPTPLEGSMFKAADFRYFYSEGDVYILKQDDGSRKVVLRSQCLIFGSADPALSKSQSADYTALGVYAMTPDRDLLLIELHHVKNDQGSNLQLLKSVQVRHQPAFIAVESQVASFGIMEVAVKAGLPIKPVPARGDKMIRALTAKARMETHSVYFNERLQPTPLTELEPELLEFPSGEHDDMVDQLSYAALSMMEYGSDSLPEQPGMADLENEQPTGEEAVTLSVFESMF